jgi:pyruvate ferredoxin oxidoreductase gamma subunit
MYRIRFHGRGGQGMKTAARILGTAFFLEGFVVQDAPRYGAERRGAPIFAYVRASRGAVNERGVIHNPDLVLVADETLAAISPGEIMHGVTGRTVLLIHGSEDAETWRERLAFCGTLLALPGDNEGVDGQRFRFAGISCAGAAARLAGGVSRSSLEKALRTELSRLGEALVARSLERALNSYDRMAPHEGIVTPGGEIAATEWVRPEWVDLPFEGARVSAPDIFAPATSGVVKSGLWRTVRPVIQREPCRRCRLCGASCPDGCIAFDATGFPDIDYEHCKGCLICVAQCPAHAIRAVPEQDGRREGGVT